MGREAVIGRILAGFSGGVRVLSSETGEVLREDQSYELLVLKKGRLVRYIMTPAE